MVLTIRREFSIATKLESMIYFQHYFEKYALNFNIKNFLYAICPANYCKVKIQIVSRCFNYFSLKFISY